MSVSSARLPAWIAIGAAVAAALAALHRGRVGRHPRCGACGAAQEVLLGGGKGDLVDFAVSLQGRIDDLHRAVDEVAAGLRASTGASTARVAKTSIVRYDAYEDTGGHQSASLALLDSARTGIVAHRDPGPRLRARST